MSFDGLTLKRVIEELQTTLIGGRIDKIYQLEDFSFLFYVHKKKRHQLLISASKHQTRTYLSEKRYEKPMNPPLFCRLLRKHLEGAYIKNIEQKANDRIMIITLQGRDSLGDITERLLIFEALGKDANLVLLDQNQVILDALNHTHPFDDVDRTMIPSAKYIYPEDERIDPFDKRAVASFFKQHTPTDVPAVLNQFQGVSPQFAKEFLHRPHQEAFKTFEAMVEENNPQVIEAKKMAFAVYDLTHIKGSKTPFDSVSAMLDYFFSQKDSKELFLQRNKDLTQFINKQLKKQTRKIERLNQDLKKALESETYKDYGNLILAHQHQIKAGDIEAKLFDYQANKEVIIPLDRKLSVVDNAQAYFKRYKKLKKSIPHIKRQIIKAKNERTYFRLLESQLQDVNLSDLEQMREELSAYGYIKPGKRSQKLSKKAGHIVYIDALGQEILVGKNNLQNAHITHEVAKANDVWFHVQGAPGSHVVVKAPLEELKETTIRTAAQLAAYHSKMRYSSSVPVDYTKIKNVKKIPGQKACFVKYTQQKTIYIDPDEDFVSSLKKQP